jgi:hypothetical protein
MRRALAITTILLVIDALVLAWALFLHPIDTDEQQMASLNIAMRAGIAGLFLLGPWLLLLLALLFRRRHASS